MIAWQGPPMPPTRLHALLLAAAAGPLAACFVDPGNTGTAGKFYAKVKKTATCKGDTSKTIRATR